MNWIKKGIIFNPKKTNWSFSHASIPTPILINNRIRVYYSTRNKDNQSNPSYFETDINDPTIIKYVHNKPILDIGKPGTFDDNGVLLCSVIKIDTKKYYMFYAGFELSLKVRYRLLSGIAVSNDGGCSFNRILDVPILDRINSEYLFRGGPFCLKEKEKFKLWYCSGDGWVNINSKNFPKYEISYLESDDILNWQSKSVKHISITEKDEHAFGRPYVLGDNNGNYEMFYSIRKTNFAQYRMGYAQSEDGYKWIRKDAKLNLDVSKDGFDNKAIMYAAPIKANGKLFLFYNGNDFGVDGIGLAIREYK